MALDPLTAVLNIGNSIIERLFPDKSQQEQAKAALLTLQVQGELQQVIAQIDVDKTEAASNSMFVAGWRPAVGWICGLGIGCDVIVRPLLSWVSTVFGHPLTLPPLDLSTLMPLLLGMLGLGAMRSWDKTQGAANGH